MSRIGKKPIPIPDKVQVTIDGSQVTVKGPKGELRHTFPAEMVIKQEDGQIVVERPSDHRQHRAFHGLTRALLANMVTGVTEGFTRRLIINGVGFRAELQGRTLVLYVGYSHPVRIEAPEGVNLELDRAGRTITVAGADKAAVGELAAQVRAVRPPEPYHGVGIAYEGEVIRRKAGKAGRGGGKK